MAALIALGMVITSMDATMDDPPPTPKMRKRIMEQVQRLDEDGPLCGLRYSPLELLVIQSKARVEPRIAISVPHTVESCYSIISALGESPRITIKRSAELCAV